jgi:hypothetical protein
MSPMVARGKLPTSFSVENPSGTSIVDQNLLALALLMSPLVQTT